jgi:hypothetical protein
MAFLWPYIVLILQGHDAPRERFPTGVRPTLVDVY